MKIDLDITDTQALLDKLNAIGSRKSRNAIRRAVSRAGTVFLQTVRPLTPVRTGLLRQSMGKKDSSHKRFTAYSIIGPRRRFGGMVSVKTAASRTKRAKRNAKVAVANKPRYQKPVKYAHLVEKGHKGPGGKGFVRGRPFLLAARLIARQQVLNVMRMSLQQGLIAEANTPNSDNF